MYLYRYLDLLPFVQVDPPATIRQQSTKSELTAATVVRSGYNLISTVGLFDIACREWRTKCTSISATKLAVLSQLAPHPSCLANVLSEIPFYF
jgi:hypothetical protein